MSTMQKTARRVRDRAAREAALIAAACKLFARRGYEVTTTREIAAAAGCAEGLIHRYFAGKAGLLLALIRSRISHELADMTVKLQPAASLENDVMQLAEFEIDRTWKERDFFRVIIPRAIVDPKLGHVIRTVSASQRAKAIADRLNKFDESRALSHTDMEGLAHFIGVVGFTFGFMRPVVLGDDREHAKRLGLRITKTLIRGLGQTIR
ncbi:MAG TPA: helix-turn-helix domain-containing protein [Terriglobales bacterium]|nr:helix-turn-helix domain-containing protein [Terriglobales bacterium]